MPKTPPAYPPDHRPAVPWLMVSVTGVRRNFSWSPELRQQLRLHEWAAYWNPAPGASMEVDGKYLELGPEVFALIPAGSWTRRLCSAPFDQWWSHFQLAAEPLRPGLQTLEVDRSLGRQLRRSWDLAWNQPEATAGTAASQLVLAMALDRIVWRDPAPRADGRFTALMDRLTQEGLPHLDNASLAARLEMHPTAFCRRFRQLVGVPPQDWLRDRRLAVAARQLAEGLSVEQVSDLGGFTDRFHFSRLFRRFSGIAPGRYRDLAALSAAPA